MLDRFAIDDGRHLPETVIDEDASTVAGEARYRARCSCGWAAGHPELSRDGSLVAHAEHAVTRIHPSRGPAWLPLEGRLALLFLACLVLWGLGVFGGVALADALHLAGGAELGARAGGVLAGVAAAVPDGRGASLHRAHPPLNDRGAFRHHPEGPSYADLHALRPMCPIGHMVVGLCPRG